MIGRFTRLTTTFRPAWRGSALAGNSPQLILVLLVQPPSSPTNITREKERWFQFTAGLRAKNACRYLIQPSRYTYGARPFEFQRIRASAQRQRERTSRRSVWRSGPGRGYRNRR